MRAPAELTTVWFDPGVVAWSPSVQGLSGSAPGWVA